MKIIKKAQSLIKGLILNTKSNSTEDTYSCDYINNIKIESESVPTGSIFDYDGTDVPEGYEKVDDSDYTKLKERLDALYDDIYYKDGDTFSPRYDLDCVGHLTSSKSRVYIYIPVPKSLKNIKSFTIDSLIGAIRNADGGYLGPDRGDLLSLGEVNQRYIPTDNMLYIRIQLTEPSTFTNNTPLTIALDPETKITFHE